MKVMLSGGGTAGHINPALAIARYIRKRQPDAQILFVGAKGGMEEKLVTEAGFPLETFPLSGMMRSISPRGIKHNLRSYGLMRKAMKGVDRLLDTFQPDVILGTGGFVCFPPLYRGAKRGIPTLVHESNVRAGKSNVALARYVDRVLLGFADAEKFFSQKEKLLLTGNPLREGMLFADKAKAKKELGISGPLVYSAFGSLGASGLNRAIGEMFAIEQAQGYPFRHIHSAGIRGFAQMDQQVRQAGVDLSQSANIDLREYVYDAPKVLAAADIMICRAGAMTVSELCATGTPAIIIPSPNVVDHHQHINAHMLADHGAAVFLEEADATPQKLFDTVTALLADPERLQNMHRVGMELAVFNAEETIYQAMTDLIHNRNTGAK